MTDFALLTPEGQIARVESFDEAPDLAPNKGRWLPVSVLAFDRVSQVQGDLSLSDDGAAVCRPVRAKTADEVAAMRAAKVDAVKAEAERRIVAVMPEWRQRNSLALGLELVTTLGTDVSAWPAEQRATYASVMASWAQIKALRATSDALEASVPTDPAAIEVFDPMAGWE